MKVIPTLSLTQNSGVWAATYMPHQALQPGRDLEEDNTAGKRLGRGQHSQAETRKRTMQPGRD